MNIQPQPTPPPVPASPAGAAPAETGDATGGIIPYKNPHALAAYYLGLFSLIPFVGGLLALAAVPLGISGLKQRRLRPVIRGSVHAWIGIGFGSLSLLGHAFLLLSIIAAATRR